ncbi:Uncharacterised protein [Salmonella enterica subsp. enterica]|uniref:Uncharacterized protein n=1 Tax=Salmonella enterica I TaxID=59201 RepID=A0A379UQV5_SALET|nr:Uncharacterised protein [Salmonella enterica subsp. enterica]
MYDFELPENDESTLLAQKNCTLVFILFYYIIDPLVK